MAQFDKLGELSGSVIGDICNYYDDSNLFAEQELLIRLAVKFTVERLLSEPYFYLGKHYD